MRSQLTGSGVEEPPEKTGFQAPKVQAKMAKLSKLSSWFNFRSSSSNNDTRKKQNRNSFAAFSSAGVSTVPSPSKSQLDLLSSRVAIKDDMARSSRAASPHHPRALFSSTMTNTFVPAQSTSTSQMVALAQKITAETEKLDIYMRDHGLPMPGFDVDAPADFPDLPENVQESRQEIIHATKALRELAVGPREGVRWGVWDFLDVLALQLINHYGIAKLVPPTQTITLSELATLTPLDHINLARILRTAMTNNIFAEPSPGIIAHTAASRLLATDPELAAWVGFNAEDIFPAAGHVLPALKSFPEATSLTRSGFQFAFNTVDVEPMFVTFGRDAERARRMGMAMASLTGGEGYEVDYLIDVEGGGYDFSEIDARSGTFVDIGGSHGFVCVHLARQYKNMKFVVQDLPKTVTSAPDPSCEDEQVSERIAFMAHDFFTEQDFQGADVYYFRWIFHNYSTPYAIKILQNLIPALKPGARILINDHCLLEPGQENTWDEKIVRRMDMVMLTLLNAQERTEAEFRELFRSASDGFVFKGVMRPKGCRMSIIEAVWKPDEVEPEDEMKWQGPDIPEEDIPEHIVPKEQNIRQKNDIPHRATAQNDHPKEFSH